MMNDEAIRDVFLDSIHNTIHCLDISNEEMRIKAIGGHYWYCLINSPMSAFFNTTLSESFECSETESFRWIWQPKDVLNPFLYSVRKTKKKNVYAFQFAMLLKEKTIIGKQIKFSLLESRIKRLCSEQYQADGNKYNPESEDKYKKIYMDSIVFLDKDIVSAPAYKDLLEALCIGIINMYQSITATCVCTDYAGGWLMFPIEHEEMLNAIFKYRDIEDGHKRRSPVYSVVREHSRGGNAVERHIRSKGFTYNGRTFGIKLGLDAFNNQFDIHDNKQASAKAIARMKKTDTDDFSDDGLIFREGAV